MNTTVKTILIWVLILVAAVGFYSFVEGQNKRADGTLTLNELLNKANAIPTEIAEVTINGSNITGKLTSGADFTSTIPTNYPAVYEQLATNGVRVTVLPPVTSDWIAGLPTVIVLVGSLVWLAISIVILALVADLSRFVKRELARISGSRSVV